MYLSDIYKIYFIENTEQIWYMKKSVFYFQVKFLNRKSIFFACQYKSTCLKWISLIYEAMSFYEKFKPKNNMKQNKDDGKK